MRLTLFLAALTLPTLAHAQPLSPALPITLSPSEQSDLTTSLSRLPYYEAAPFIAYLQMKQVEAQRAAAQTPAKQSPTLSSPPAKKAP